MCIRDWYRNQHGLTDVNEWDAWTNAEVRRRLADNAMTAPKREELHHEFVRRLVVVHRKALEAIAKRSGGESVTEGYEMDSLVQNAAHLIKYRRCVKLAKLIYLRKGRGSLHDQDEAKLLNKEFAHAHQDERDTEMGIARRIIRQAHVANHVHYQYATPNKAADAVGSDVQCMIDGKKGNIYRTDAYYTNPPMAPILCASPPRMGKTAMSLLVASFAAKLGGNVMYLSLIHI